ncbi:MAG: hypothetical protein RQ842_03190 [Vulcanisaeta sp.]|nr:hypothetical protein [Vulcanisaeta sp.]
MTPQQETQDLRLKRIAEELIYRANMERKGGRVFLCLNTDTNEYYITYNEDGMCVKFVYKVEPDFSGGREVEVGGVIAETVWGALTKAGVNSAIMNVKRINFSLGGDEDLVGSGWAFFFDARVDPRRAVEVLEKVRMNLPGELQERVFTFDAGDAHMLRVKVPVPSQELVGLVGEVVSKILVPGVDGDVNGGEAQETVNIELPPSSELTLTIEAPPSGGAVGGGEGVGVSEGGEASVGRRELVPIYLLAMQLPSEYLVQSISRATESDGSGGKRVVEVRSWVGDKAELAEKINQVRKYVYKHLKRHFAYLEDFGWVAVTEEGVNEARRVGDYVVRKLMEFGITDPMVLRRYFVRPIRVYLEPEDARRVLEEAIGRIREDLEKLEEKIGEAEREGRRRRVEALMRDREFLEKLLGVFREYYARVGGS